MGRGLGRPGGARDDGPVTSGATGLADGSAGIARTGSRVGRLAVGRVAAVASIALCLLIQQVNHDFFPPAISVSQYGIGRWGWVFTAWAAVVVLATLALHAGGTVRGNGAGPALLTGAAGLIVMGVVRTDAGGLQHSVHAKVHMVGSIVGLIALPIGMALAMAHTRRWWRRLAWSLVVAGSASLIMVLISAYGVATPGLDAAHSWALWQAIAVTLDMLLLSSLAISSFPGQQMHPAQ